MKKLIILAISICVLSACSQAVDDIRIDSRLGGYVEEFNKLYVARYGGQPAVQASAVFGDLQATSNDGQCRISNVNRTIVIDKALFDSYCPSQKRALVFHELGHCVLGRGHSSTNLSYMYYANQSCSFYNENKAHLDKELFM